MTAPQVRPLTAADWPQVARVFAEGIATGHATFESAAPAWEEWDAGHLPAHRFVATDDEGAVLGWVAASPVSGRCVYSGVVEGSVYVGEAARGRGVGRTLLAALLDSALADGVWTVQAGVFPENAASVRLHQEAGFRVVGTRERMGRMEYGPMAGRWRDVLLLEKRFDVG
ncbi:MAG TPA: GNAT family N-acetyltransferase [Friedmanniella sp.]